MTLIMPSLRFYMLLLRVTHKKSNNDFLFSFQVECISLIIACLCHDLDHRGTNNSFQVKSSSNLAQLYSTSTMEHHHFDQCLMILNSKGNQILANVSQVSFEEY